VNNVSSPTSLTTAGRWAVLAAAFLGLVFDGIELGLMPVASLSVTHSLLGADFSRELGGQWFAWFTAALMFGAAVGGSILGNLGDRIGRSSAMGVSILCYSLFAGLGAFVQSCEQMLILRFLVGLGVGGMWPNGVALVAECWPNTSRPTVSGVLGAGINAGIICLSILGSIHPITPESWRWLFMLAAVPAVLGILVLTLLPESPKWLASRDIEKAPPVQISKLFQGQLLPITVAGILLASVPLVGAWAGSKWMLPWADQVGGATRADYKSLTQWWWAVGATIGSFLGAPLAAYLGRRSSYFAISIGATALTWAMFRLTAPLEDSFLPIVFAQGLVATLYFGWLPLYLPELFPIEIRATGAGISMNIGRFVTALSILLIGAQFKGDYPELGAACAMIYALGLIVVFWAPKTDNTAL
jgi:MFS transporter, SHS family, sialic acid transporter